MKRGRSCLGDQRELVWAREEAVLWSCGVRTDRTGLGTSWERPSCGCVSWASVATSSGAAAGSRLRTAFKVADPLDGAVVFAFGSSELYANPDAFTERSNSVKAHDALVAEFSANTSAYRNGG